MHVGLVWLVKLGPEFLVLDSFRYTLEHDMHFVCSVCVCCLCSAVSEFSNGFLSGVYNLFVCYIQTDIII